MKRHKVLKPNPYTIHLRVLLYSFILGMLVIAYLSLHQPDYLASDSISHLVGRVGMALVLLSVLGSIAAAHLNAQWRLRQSLQVDVFEDRIVQQHGEGAAIEIPFQAIKSAFQRKGWLVVQAGEPLKSIAIPYDIDGFQEIRDQIAAFCPIGSPKSGTFAPSLIPLVLIATASGASALLFFARSAPAILIGSIALLVVQAIGLWAAIRLYRLQKTTPKLLILAIAATLPVTVWVIYLYLGTRGHVLKKLG